MYHPVTLKCSSLQRLKKNQRIRIKIDYIRFIGPKIWNEVDETFKKCKKYKVKKMLKNSLIQCYSKA